MMGWMVLVSGFFTDSICILLYFFLIRTWDGGRKEKSHTAVLGTAFFLAALSGLLFILKVPEFPILTVQVILAASAGAWIYGIRRKRALFLAVEYAMALSLWKFILCGAIGVILRMDTLPGRGTGGNLAADWIVCVLTGVLSFFLYKKRLKI